MALVWKLLTVMAVMLMPFGMSGTPAVAAQYHAASMPMQHCPEQAPNHHGRAGFTECTMACSAALPAAELASKDLPLLGSEPVRPAAVNRLHGLHPETATPPPKLS